MHEQKPLRGVFLLLNALFFFAVLDATAKYLTQTFSIPMLVWARYLTHCLLMAIFLGPRMGRGLVASKRPLRQVTRAILLLGCTGFGFAALSRMPLAETTATAFTAPLMVAILAGPWLKERLSGYQWLAVLAGFGGVLLIARPGGAVTADGIAFALLAAACYAVYQILTRQLAVTENSVTMLFYTALVGSVAMTLFLPWYWAGPMPSATEAAMIAGLGILGGCGHFLLIRAFRHAPASTLSPFIYIQLVWAILLGALVFSHWPDGFALLGSGVIVACGLYLGLSARYNGRPSPEPS
ncbi:MAG TPA: DMT family transporter [Rhodocyclaceae bacterium]|nr:DMT family transporter [Rhodocyclaceae bacterium]